MQKQSMHQQIDIAFAFICTMNDLKVTQCDYKCKTTQMQTKLVFMNDLKIIYEGQDPLEISFGHFENSEYVW